MKTKRTISLKGTKIAANYGAHVAAALVINCAAGVGSLSIPKTVDEAGIVFGSLFMLISAFFAWVAFQFIIEGMSIALALLRSGVTHYVLDRKERHPIGSDEHNSEIGGESLFSEETMGCASNIEGEYETENPFSITVRLEPGKISEILWGKKGQILCYIALLIYLIGDVAIYCSGFSTTLQGILPIISVENGGTMLINYRIYAAIFIVIDFPLSLLNLEHTRVLQIILISIRFLAFFVMIVLAFVFIGGNYVVEGDVGEMANKWNVAKMPSLFGTITYSFMVHHSAANFVAPVTNKNRLGIASLISYIGLFVLYFLLSWSTSIAFENGTVEICTIDAVDFPGEVCELQDMVCDSFINLNWWGGFFAYFLAIYPAVILLFNNMFVVNSARSNTLQLVSFLPTKPKLRWVLITLMIYVPGVIIGILVPDIGILIDVTGGVLGLFIMFVFPTLFVFQGRKLLKKHTALDYHENPHRSYFSHPAWLIVMAVWIAFCSVLDVANIVLMFLPSKEDEQTGLSWT